MSSISSSSASTHTRSSSSSRSDRETSSLNRSSSLLDSIFSSACSDWDSGNDGDEEDTESESEDSGSESESAWSMPAGDEDEDIAMLDEFDDEEYQGHGLGTHTQHILDDLYRERYRQRRGRMPRAPPTLPTVLQEWKHSRPDLFRQELRINPTTFDELVAALEGHSIFANDSPNPQLSVESQVALTLFRFGHSGNAAGLQKVATWAGAGKGTVLKCTRRVITAILDEQFMKANVRLPNDEEKRDAQAWVRAHSCRKWGKGYLLVDGTLVVLYDRPHWYGESYYDRKCNYSLNIQVIIFIETHICSMSSSPADHLASEPAHRRLRLRLYRKHT
jgi:hypothetical protein